MGFLFDDLLATIEADLQRIADSTGQDAAMLKGIAAAVLAGTAAANGAAPTSPAPLPTSSINGLPAGLAGQRVGTVAGGATTNSIPTVGRQYTANRWIHGSMWFIDGPAAGQIGYITSNTPATFTLSNNLTVPPDPGDSFLLFLGSTTLTGTTDTIAAGNALTTLTIDMGPIAGAEGTVDAPSTVSGALYNNGTSQTITGFHVYFKDTPPALGGQSVQTDYVDLLSVHQDTVASGATIARAASLIQGVLRECYVDLVFSSAPTQGQVQVQLTLGHNPTTMGVVSSGTGPQGGGSTGLTPYAVPYADGQVTSGFYGLATDAYLHALNPTSGKWDDLRVDGTTHHLWTRDDAAGTPAAAVPTSALLVAGSDGTDLRPLATDNTGALKLAAGTIDIGKVDQGTAAAVAGAWPVKVTDGTNTMPTMDAAARAGFVQAGAGALADGADVTEGAKADAAVTDPTVSASVVAILKGLLSVGNSKQGAVTDRSGTITTGGTAQQMMAGNASRRYLVIQNLDAIEDLWFNFTTTAVASEPSLKLAAGQAFSMDGSFVSTEAVSVIAATNAHAWASKEG